MKKIIIFLLIIIVGASSIFIINRVRENIYRNKIKNEREEKERLEKQALSERLEKYETLYSLRELIYKYDEYIEVKDFSTEKVEKSYPRKEYIQKLIGKTKYLFVKISDVNTINNHRVITFVGNSIARGQNASLFERLTQPDNKSAVDFIFYDDTKKIINVQKNDKLDIIARVDDVIYTKEIIENKTIEIINIYFSILDLEHIGNFNKINGINDNRLD